MLPLAGCTSSLEKAEREAATAEALFNAGNLPAARAAIGRALAFRDDQPDILLLDARIKLQMQDMRGAYDSYRTVLVFDPNNLEALTIVGRVAVMLNQKDVARDAIERALAINPSVPDVLLSKGVLLLDEEDYDAALATAETLLAAFPDDSRGIVLKARAMFLNGQRAESFALLNAATERVGKDQLIAAALLENARAEGRVSVMLEQFAVLGQANPESVDLALDEINTRYKSGDMNGARSLSASFIERFGEDAETMARLVDLWSEYDRSPLEPGAIQSLASSDKAAARLAAARFYLAQDNIPLAETFVKNSPDNRFMGFIARIHVRRGAAVGRDLAQQILEQDKTNCDALSAITEWNFDHNKPNEAIVSAQLLGTQCRDRTDGYTALAQAYQEEGRPAAVERVYREGIEAHPQNAALTRQFAQWLLSQGRNQAAISAVRRLAKAAPSRLSTWNVYRQVCATAEDSLCAQDAAAGLASAKQQYTFDPLPGVRRPDALFGRTWA